MLVSDDANRCVLTRAVGREGTKVILASSPSQSTIPCETRRGYAGRVLTDGNATRRRDSSPSMASISRWS